jgi:S-DNA-T family DNA segregation ATPase FtsK/SpoIIIE
VWPEAAASVHPGRLVLWVGDHAMADAPNPAWPLLKSGKVNLFKPFPFGTDQRRPDWRWSP